MTIMNARPLVARAAGTLAVFAFSGQLAIAQTTPSVADDSDKKSFELQEIVVTASKTGQQTLQSTPLAIQAFSGDDLKEKNIGSIQDLVGLVPGASVSQDNGGVVRSYNIRGVGGASLTNGDSPIGYYVDDIPFSVPNYGIAPPVSFVDLDRVEVLRGPQGTLYGQGAEGGIFIFHTKDPDLNDVKIDAETFTSQTRDAANLNYGTDAAVSLPLVSDKLAVRLSAQYQKDAGYADAYNGDLTGPVAMEDSNPNTTQNLRGVILFKPLDNLRIRGQVWHIHDNQHESGLFNNTDPPAFTNLGGAIGYVTANFTLYGLSAQYDLNGVSIDSSTGYVDGTFTAVYPLGAPASTLLSLFTPKSFTQELRAHSNGSAPLHWIVGGQYQDGKGPQRNILAIPPFGVDNDASNNTLTKNWAVFGETSYDLFDGKLVPLIGLREYHDTRTYVQAPDSRGASFDKLTWRVNLACLPTKDLTTFITASTGFRAGIVQSQLQVTQLQAIGLPASVLDRPDSLTNYETGVKWRTPDGVFSIDTSLYRIQYKDIQTAANGAAGVGGFINLGDAHSTGVDLEAQWRTPVKGLRLTALGNYNDSKFDSVLPAVEAQNPTITPGSRLIGNAAFNYRFDANYGGELISGIEPFGNIGFGRMGSRIMVAGQVTPAYNTLGATLGIRKDVWEVALFGENLTDTHSPTYIFSALEQYEATVRPRTIGLRVRVHY